MFSNLGSPSFLFQYLQLEFRWSLSVLGVHLLEWPLVSTEGKQGACTPVVVRTSRVLRGEWRDPAISAPGHGTEKEQVVGGQAQDCVRDFGIWRVSELLVGGQKVRLRLWLVRIEA